MPIPSPTTTHNSSKWERRPRPLLNKCQSSISGSSRTRPLFRRVSSSMHRRPEPDPGPTGFIDSRDPSPGSGATASVNSTSCSLSMSLVNRVVRCNSMFFYLLIFACISSVCYTISLWKRIAALQVCLII